MEAVVVVVLDWTDDAKSQLEEYTSSLPDEKFLQVEGTEIAVFGPGGNAADSSLWYQQLPIRPDHPTTSQRTFNPKHVC